MTLQNQLFGRCSASIYGWAVKGWNAASVHRGVTDGTHTNHEWAWTAKLKDWQVYTNAFMFLSLWWYRAVYIWNSSPFAEKVLFGTTESHRLKTAWRPPCQAWSRFASNDTPTPHPLSKPEEFMSVLTGARHWILWSACRIRSSSFKSSTCSIPLMEVPTSTLQWRVGLVNSYLLKRFPLQGLHSDE